MGVKRSRVRRVGFVEESRVRGLLVCQGVDLDTLSNRRLGSYDPLGLLTGVLGVSLKRDRCTPEKVFRLSDEFGCSVGGWGE